MKLRYYQMLLFTCDGDDLVDDRLLGFSILIPSCHVLLIETPQLGVCEPHPILIGVDGGVSTVVPQSFLFLHEENIINNNKKVKV